MVKFEYSLCTAEEPIRKTISLDPDTGELIKKPPSYFPYEFRATTKQADLETFAQVLTRVKPNQFLIHGTAERSPTRVVTKEKKETVYKNRASTVARTPEYFRYKKGQPGLFMLDIDLEGYTLEEIHGMLVSLYPKGFEQAGYVAFQSSSSNVYNTKTGEYYSGSKWHLYFVAQQGHDIRRFAQALFDYSILKGYGHVFISRDGKQHIRTFFDLAVIDPSRIDFIAPPKCKPPLAQDAFVPTVHPGTYLDTQSFKDYKSSKYKSKYARIVKELKRETADEAHAVREKHIEKNIKKYMEATQKPRKVAEEVVRARYVDSDEVRLHMEDLIIFEDGDEEAVFVHEILEDIDAYLNRSVKDPLEPEYGDGKAKLFLSYQRLVINSFCHGGRKFILSGTLTTDYDSDNIASVLGFRLDANAINGAWMEQMLKTWFKIGGGGKTRFVRIDTTLNRYIPIPEKGESASPHFGQDPVQMYDKKNFLDLMPAVKVVTGWDPQQNKPREDYIGPAFLRLPNIEVKKAIVLSDPAVTDSCYLNRWVGFPVTGKKGRVHSIIDQFFEEFILWENEECYEFFWSYIYHIFQHPFEKPGTAILFQSTQGTGKGTFIQMLSSLIGPIHSAFVDKMESLTGRFNDIIAGKLLVYADEVTFGGYHAANNILKKIISDEYLTVEPKYQAHQQLFNVSRLFFSTNEQWGLSIERGDRRYFVPRVSTAFQQDHEFFTELRYQWNRFYENVMYRFQNMPITADVSQPPMTKDKAELIEVSMDSAEYFILEILRAGVIEPTGTDFYEPIVLSMNGPNEIPTNQLYDCYKAFHNKNFGRVAEPMKITVFWKEIYSFFGGAERSGIKLVGRKGTSKRRVVLPSLQRLRLLWDESHNSSDFEDISSETVLTIVK